MARARKHRSMLSLLTAAVGAIPALQAALVVMAPASAALAAAPHGPAPATLAQAIARGDTTIAPKQVQAMILAQRRDFTLVDIRSPAAFAAGHIRDARNVPLAKLGSAEEINVLRRSPQVILDGNPSAAPLLCARDVEDLVFLSHRASRIAAQLSINPRVQAILRGDEATAGLSLEIGGFCAEVADAEQRQRLVALLASAHDDVDRMLGGDTAARIWALEDAYP